MKDEINRYIPYLILISILLADLLIYTGLIKIFFDGSDTIIAGVIGFVGAVLGGVITYRGVNKTLKHRNREVFLSTATEKLAVIDQLITTYQKYLNSAFIYEYAATERGERDQVVLALLRDFYEQISNDKEKFYKNMTYDEATIINFHIKTIRLLMHKSDLNKGEIAKGIEVIRSIFDVFLISQKKLERKYYEYSKTE